MTLANRITLFRCLLSIVCLVLLHVAVQAKAPDSLLLDLCTGLVLVAAVLDVVDGYVARRQGEVTRLGRVLDPLVDKILICGCFIFLVRLAPLEGIVEPWVPAVVVVREFAVHAVRLDIEASGQAFGATVWGKQKTFLQTVAAVGCLMYASHMHALESGPAFRKFVLVLVGLAVASTVVSGIIYAASAVKSLRAGHG